MFKRIVRTRHEIGPLIVRLGLGIVFFPHGAQKVLGIFGGFGFSATMGFFEHSGIPAVFAFLAICAEFLGSLGLITGLLTRVAAFGIGVNMLVAIFTVHISNGFFMNWMGNQKGEGFEYHLLVLAMVISLLVTGGGAFSVDEKLAQ